MNLPLHPDTRDETPHITDPALPWDVVPLPHTQTQTPEGAAAPQEGQHTHPRRASTLTPGGAATAHTPTHASSNHATSNHASSNHAASNLEGGATGVRRRRVRRRRGFEGGGFEGGGIRRRRWRGTKEEDSKEEGFEGGGQHYSKTHFGSPGTPWTALLPRGTRAPRLRSSWRSQSQLCGF